LIARAVVDLYAESSIIKEVFYKSCKRLLAKLVWGRKTASFSPVFVEFFAEYSRFRLQNSP